MCLSRPARLMEVALEHGVAHLAPLPGETGREIALDLRLTPGVGVGDWVIVHAGAALERIEPDDAEALIELLAALAALAGDPAAVAEFSGGTP